MSARIVLVDDQALFREALATWLDGQDGFEVVGQAGNGRDGVALALELRPDLVLMDVDMPVMDGVAAASVLLNRLPQTRVVMLTVSDSGEDLLRAVRLGVHGYLLKDAEPDEFLRMLHRVLDSGTSVAPELLGRLLAELRTPESVPAPAGSDELSRRELEIMQLAAEGLSNRAIGMRLFITEGTVKNHVHNALTKLGVSTRGQAVAQLVREGRITH